MLFEDCGRAFFSLLEEPEVQAFLKKDCCNTLADRYVLASVFIYFVRAKFVEEEYNVKNFFLAVHLCHDIYEEIDEYKDDIIDYYISINHKTYHKSYKVFQKFMKDRFMLFKRMSFKGHVPVKLCDHLIRILPHWAWNRIRAPNHAGAHRSLPVCTKCL